MLVILRAQTFDSLGAHSLASIRPALIYFVVLHHLATTWTLNKLGRYISILIRKNQVIWWNLYFVKDMDLLPICIYLRDVDEFLHRRNSDQECCIKICINFFFHCPFFLHRMSSGIFFTSIQSIHKWQNQKKVLNSFATP